MALTELPDWFAQARRSGVVSRLPARIAAAMIEGAKRASYPAGSTLVGWDAEPAGVIVLAGSFRVYLSAQDGNQVTLRYIRPGDIVGVFSGAEGAPVRNLEALDDSELLHLDVPRVAAVMRSEPDLAWEMVNEMTRVLRIVWRAYGIRASGSIRLRVANAIVERALARGGMHPGTLVPGTQAELAVAAGTVREVVAGALRDMRHDGIIEVRRGGLVILDAARLAREADGGFGLAAG